MIPDQQQAHKILPLISTLDAYEAFVLLIKDLREQAVQDAKSIDAIETQRAIGKLMLLDDLKELRERVKDSLKNDRPTANQPFL